VSAERDVRRIDETVLGISDQPIAAQPDTLRLLDLMEQVHPDATHSLGFAENQEPGAEYLTPLVAAFLRCVRGMDPGDDFREHTGPYERAVRELFAELVDAPWGAAARVTACDGEGIRLGLATAREHMRHAPVYASDNAHAGVAQAAAALGLELATIPSLPDGTMDANALRRAVLARNAAYSIVPGLEPGAIVVATCGTATTGAVDDVVALRRAAAAAGAVHVHTDASYGGLIAAHAPSAPNWSFTHGADSVSISAHRVLGLPLPWGIVFSRRDIVAPPTPPCTWARGEHLDPFGAGLGTLFVWAALRRLGRTGLRAHILRRLETAAYAVRRLEEAGAGPSRSPESLTVTLTRPSDRLAGKWHLSCEGDVARIVCLGHVTRSAIDEFTHDLAGERHDRQALAVEPAA
jgi:histidine decarboxylase